MKLKWMNGEYLKAMDFDKFFELAKPYISETVTKDYDLKKIAALVKTRIEILPDIKEQIDFFEELGVKTKIERGERVFPVSDHSSDVIAAFSRELKSLGVSVSLHTEVRELLCEQDKVCGVLLTNGKKMKADAVIVATGGISYPSTGSTGDGYRFAKETGHRVTELLPSLVPMEVRQWYAKELQGLSLRNIEIRITDGKKKLYEEFGEMLFTHYGVTGPVILSASSVVGKTLEKKNLHFI